MEPLKDLLIAILVDHQVLQLLGTIATALLIWLLKTLISWTRLKLRADRLRMLESVVDKAMTHALVMLEDTIRENGWDSQKTKSEVLATALPILKEKFQDTLKENGINLDDKESRALLIQQMQRMLPDVFTRAAASPATPPAPVVPVASITPNTGA